MRSELVRFLSWMVPTGGALVALGGLLGGVEELGRGLTAFAVCIILALASLEFACRSLPKGLNWQLGAILGGSLFRSGAALAIGLLLYRLVPVFHTWEFWLWMAAMYLGTLAAEVTLLYAAIRQINTPPARSRQVHLTPNSVKLQ